jgi:hypothetical protein
VKTVLMTTAVVSIFGLSVGVARADDQSPTMHAPKTTKKKKSTNKDTAVEACINDVDCSGDLKCKCTTLDGGAKYCC